VLKFGSIPTPALFQILFFYQIIGLFWSEYLI